MTLSTHLSEPHSERPRKKVEEGKNVIHGDELEVAANQSASRAVGLLPQVPQLLILQSHTL